MNASELLARIAATLRADIGPAVGDEFARTQAFMAAVVLKKLADQLTQQDAHALAGAREISEMLLDLQPMLMAAPAPIAAAFSALRSTADATATKQYLGAFIQSLYDERAALGESRFTAALTRVRQYLRADIDRQLVYAS